MAVLTMSIDATIPGRLELRGDADGSDVQRMVDEAAGVLASCHSHVVIDTRGVTSAGVPLVELLNDVALRAAAINKSVVVEVPDDAAEWLASASLHRAIRVERTCLMPAPVRTRPPASPATDRTANEPADGVVRREGKGFINSYGGGRQCAQSGCSTKLSRYNSDYLCALHTPHSGFRTIRQP